jgi:hypothetical protein
VVHPGRATLDGQLHRRLDPRGIVEGEHRQVDLVGAPFEGQGRAAGGAEAALDGVRTLEARRRPARPGQVGDLDGDQRPERPGEGLLAHPAMADRGAARLALDAETHRAALASTGQGKIGHRKPQGLCGGTGRIGIGVRRKVTS